MSHKHEWRFIPNWFDTTIPIVGCTIDGCDELLNANEIIRRLNTHADLLEALGKISKYKRQVLDVDSDVILIQAWADQAVAKAKEGEDD